jgi:hypothetical protein
VSAFSCIRAAFLLLDGGRLCHTSLMLAASLPDLDSLQSILRLGGKGRKNESGVELTDVSCGQMCRQDFVVLLHGVSCGRSDSLGPRTISNETSKEKDDEVHREVQHPQGFCR